MSNDDTQRSRSLAPSILSFIAPVLGAFEPFILRMRENTIERAMRRYAAEAFDKMSDEQLADIGISRGHIDGPGLKSSFEVTTRSR